MTAMKYASTEKISFLPPTIERFKNISNEKLHQVRNGV